MATPEICRAASDARIRSSFETEPIAAKPGGPGFAGSGTSGAPPFGAGPKIRARQARHNQDASVLWARKAAISGPLAKSLKK